MKTPSNRNLIDGPFFSGKGYPNMNSLNLNSNHEKFGCIITRSPEQNKMILSGSMHFKNEALSVADHRGPFPVLIDMLDCSRKDIERIF